VASANLGETKRSPAATFRIAFQDTRIVALRDITLNGHLDRAHYERGIFLTLRMTILAAGSDTPCQLEAGEVGKPYVHNRDVGMLLQIRPVARLRIGNLQNLDGRVRREQGPAAGHDNRMVVDDQHPHDDLVPIRTSLPPPVVENVGSAVLVRNN
jgi:hypothetical protein